VDGKKKTPKKNLGNKRNKGKWMGQDKTGKEVNGKGGKGKMAEKKSIKPHPGKCDLHYPTENSRGQLERERGLGKDKGKGYGVRTIQKHRQ